MSVYKGTIKVGTEVIYPETSPSQVVGISDSISSTIQSYLNSGNAITFNCNMDISTLTAENLSYDNLTGD